MPDVDDAASVLNNTILPQETQTKSAVTFGLDANPDDAAKTVDLSKSTGVPTAVISPDLDNFTKQHQAQMARDLVMNNGQLRDYVNSNPEAAKVSNDDWGQLDKVSQQASAFSSLKSWLGGIGGSVGEAADAEGQANVTAGQFVGSAVGGAVTGAIKGFGSEPLIDSTAVAKAFPALDPAKGPMGLLANLSATTILGGGEILGRTLMGGGGGAIMGAMGGMFPDTGPASFGHAMQEVTEATMADMGSRIHMEMGGDWLQAGEEPPKGLSPSIDAGKAESNAKAVDQLTDLMKEAQASATKERSPEMFRQFMDQHFGNDTIGIDGDAVAKLYGGKPPDPDDGKLGWAVGINDKLDAAIHTGQDVEIPLSHWVANIDPALAKELHDDIRVWPGGVTAREAGKAKAPEEGEAPFEHTPVEYPQIIDAPLPQVRAAAGTEPMFSMGDRKLSLVKTGEDSLPEYNKDMNMVETPGHQYDILDDRGRTVGQLHFSLYPEDKLLHVDHISGVAGQWANSFGPSLIMDLKRQIAGMYPEYENLGGVRVSGARRIDNGASSYAQVKLANGDAPAGWDSIEATRRVLASAYRPVGETGVDVNIQPSSTYLAHEKAVAGAIHDEIAKITGGKAKVQPVAGIRYRERAPEGVHFPHSGMIMYDLIGQDPVGVGRHEAIHFLRDQGLFTDKEWNTLSDAARDENWHDRYDINARYEKLGPEAKTEEAIAEGFREWMGAREGARREYSPVAQIFQKLHDFLQNIRGRMAEIFGFEPTKDQLFSKIASGEIGERASQGSTGDAPKFSEADHLDNLKASGLGLDLKSFQRIQKLVEDRYKADVEATLRHTEKEQAKRQTKEWKENKNAMAADVEATIRQRPDVAADLFIGSGELYGQKIQQRFTLREADLTPEQKAALPAHYVSKNGLPVDEVGKMFGYTSGDAMVSHMATYNALKGGKSPQEMLRRVVDAETDRQMEAKHGNLAENILTEAKDQALSENDLNLLVEEYHAAAQQAGVTGVDKEVVQAKAKDIVSKMHMNEVNVEKQMTVIGKNYRDAVRSLVGGDPASAVVALERRTLAGFVAAEMKKVAGEKAKFDNLAKRYAKPWDPTKTATIAPDFSLFIRDQLSRVGMRYGMSVPGLAKAIGESGFNDLADFVTKTEDSPNGKLSGLELSVPDWLMSSHTPAKSYPTMTVAEFREFRDSITSMDTVGRADQKIIKGGEAQDRKDWISQATTQLKNKFPALAKQASGIRQAARTFAAVMTSNETLMSRFDGRDPHGIFTETISKPAAEASNTKARLMREIEAQYHDLGPVKDGMKRINSPFVNPETGKPIDFNRNNLAAVISNIGNKYNLAVLAKGWKLDPDTIMKWVESVATPEDIERAQKMGDIFKGLKSLADSVYQHMYGIAPESVVPRPFTMHGKDYPGWYHPIIGDPILSRKVNSLRDPTQAETNFWPSTSNSYMKRRTGTTQVIDLTHETVPLKMEQVIHDISFRAFVANTARIFKDDTFRQAVSNHYGKPYMDDMDTWLHRIAGDSSYNTAAMGLATRYSNMLRQNVIGTAIGFNPITVQKHGLTASLMSARALGPNLFANVPRILYTGLGEVPASALKRAVNDLFGLSPATGDSLWQFAKRNSEELQRRERNWQDALGASQRISSGMGMYATARETTTQWGSKVVALSDMLSAVPLWLAKYRDEFAQNGGVHGDAVREADMAVRNAHGSTAITNLPTVAAGKGAISPWLTSLYGFMGTNMQRRIEMMHDINDAGHLAMQGEIKAAAKMVPTILSSAAVYVVYTGAVEELATGQFTDDRRGFGSKALTFLFGTVGQTIVGLRDLTYDLAHGRESLGLLSTPIHDVEQFIRDLGKHNPTGREHAGKLVQDTCASIGDLFGVCPKHLGEAGRYGLDVFNEFQHPRTAGDIYRGVVSGQQKLRVEK